MANKTVLQLKTSLAGLWGYETWDEVTAQDKVEIEGYLSGAYFDCYAPVDGKAPNFGEQYWSNIVKAPVPASLGLTQGSTVVTGYEFEDAYVGSFVKIGERLYRYAGKVVSEGPTTTYYLVQPWQDATGTYGATIYHNAVVLPGLLLETASQYPEVLGVGVLAPIPDPDCELRLRTEPALDFRDISGRQPFNSTRRRFNMDALLETGDPEFYYVDSASTGAVFAPTNRLHIYPLSDQTFTVSMRAQFMPIGDLPADGATLAMPYQTVDNILLPLAREKLAMNTAGRRFTGEVRLIMELAERARKQLRSLTKPQRFTNGGIRTAPGW